jgi:hypothetical protein
MPLVGVVDALQRVHGHYQCRASGSGTGDVVGPGQYDAASGCGLA